MNWWKGGGKEEDEGPKGRRSHGERGNGFLEEPWRVIDWINLVTEEEGAALDREPSLASSVSQPLSNRMFVILMVFWLLFPGGDKGERSFNNVLHGGQKVSLMQLEGGRTLFLVPIMSLHFFKSRYYIFIFSFKSCGLSVRNIFLQRRVTIIKNSSLYVFLSWMKFPLYPDSLLFVNLCFRGAFL